MRIGRGEAIFTDAPLPADIALDVCSRTQIVTILRGRIARNRPFRGEMRFPRSQVTEPRPASKDDVPIQAAGKRHTPPTNPGAARLQPIRPSSSNAGATARGGHNPFQGLSR